MKAFSKMPRLLTGIAASALSLGLASTAMAADGKALPEEPAAPAPNPDSAGGGLAEIVVTAQKQATNLQTTPIAISVLDGSALQQRGVKSLEDLMDGSVPSLRVAPFFSRSSALTVGIRGIVPFDANQPSRDAGVGIYLDGVYLGRSQGLGAALYDVERIEVLKGPQGTLFGRNSTGGAVSIVTRKPTGQFGVRAVAGVGNYGAYRGEMHVDLPAWNNFSLKIDALTTRRGATVANPLPGSLGFNSYDKSGLHIGLRWAPSEVFEALYNFDISRDSTTPYYVQLLSKNPLAPALAPLVQVQANRAKAVDVPLLQEANLGHNQGHMLALSWKPAEGIEIRSITSYRKLDQDQRDNSIGAHSNRFVPNSTFARYSMASVRQRQWSEEVQFLLKTQALDLVAGIFHYDEKGDDDAWTPNTARWNATGTAYTLLPTLRAGAAWDFPDRASTAQARSTALFGQATLTPPGAEWLHITAGARYTHDRKEGHLTKVNGVTTPFSFKLSGDRIDPMVTVAVDPTETLHLYGKWSTAYRAGGANSRSVSYRAFGPETVESWEAGLKSEVWDRRLRVNLAAWTMQYRDIQIDFSATNLNNSNRGTLETVNAPGKGRLKGFEADLALAPLPGLTLTASYAYTTARLPVAVNPFNGAVQNVYIVYTPKHAASGSIDYSVPLSGETQLKFHLSGAYSGAYRTSSGENIFADKSFIANGRITVADIGLPGGARADVALWARNVFNEQHVYYRSRGSFPVIGEWGMFNEPRTFGADLTFKF